MTLLLQAPYEQELPICAVCNRPVESIERFQDHMRCRVGWIVRCHGETERVMLDDKELEECRGQLRFGRAFATKALDQ